VPEFLKPGRHMFGFIRGILGDKLKKNILGCLLLVFILGYVDSRLDPRISFSIFYVLPIMIVTWSAGYIAGILFSFLASSLWFLAAFFSHPSEYPLPILMWNTAVRLSFFLVITYTVFRFNNERKNARFDFLTGIPNRRHFMEIFQAEVERSVRYGFPLTLVYMDIDNFKHINDAMGHQSGDNLLKLVSSVIRKNIRSTDMSARLGGDEFAMVFVQCAEKTAIEIIGKLQAKLLKAVNDRGYPVTFSFGVVTFHGFPETVREMIKIADDCMYSAKKSGKNRIRTKILS
jgi:diguanylate cyclase (GGDEF)-like protein